MTEEAMTETSPEEVLIPIIENGWVQGVREIGYSTLDAWVKLSDVISVSVSKTEPKEIWVSTDSNYLLILKDFIQNMSEKEISLVIEIIKNAINYFDNKLPERYNYKFSVSTSGQLYFSPA